MYIYIHIPVCWVLLSKCFYDALWSKRIRDPWFYFLNMSFLFPSLVASMTEGHLDLFARVTGSFGAYSMQSPQPQCQHHWDWNWAWGVVLRIPLVVWPGQALSHWAVPRPLAFDFLQYFWNDFLGTFAIEYANSPAARVYVWTVILNMVHKPLWPQYKRTWTLRL